MHNYRYKINIIINGRTGLYIDSYEYELHRQIERPTHANINFKIIYQHLHRIGLKSAFLVFEKLNSFEKYVVLSNHPETVHFSSQHLQSYFSVDASFAFVAVYLCNRSIKLTIFWRRISFKSYLGHFPYWIVWSIFVFSTIRVNFECEHTTVPMRYRLDSICELEQFFRGQQKCTRYWQRNPMRPIHLVYVRATLFVCVFVQQNTHECRWLVLVAPQILPNLWQSWNWSHWTLFARFDARLRVSTLA